MKEVWKFIEGYGDRYEVSTLGRIRGWYYSGRGNHTRRDTPVVIKVGCNNRGYYRVGLHTGRKGRAGLKYPYVHRLILETFSPFASSSFLEASRLNHNKKDNRLCNLMWETTKDNATRNKSNSTFPRGENHCNAELTYKKVSRIKELLTLGISQKDIAAKYGVAQAIISRINTGKSWNLTQ